MPEMNGIETSRLILNAIPGERQPVIIAMSAGSIHDHKEEFYSAGISDFIQKPIRPELLREYLKKWGMKINSGKKGVDDQKIINEEKINFLKDIQSIEDAAFLIELIDIYIKELPRTINNIQKAIEEKNDKDLLFNAHKLKGSSLTLGMDSISEISIKLENAAKIYSFDEDVKKLGEELPYKFEIVEKELEIIRERYTKFINQPW
jgi:CheY-like chemotaxis protein